MESNFISKDCSTSGLPGRLFEAPCGLEEMWVWTATTDFLRQHILLPACNVLQLISFALIRQLLCSCLNVFKYHDGFLKS